MNRNLERRVNLAGLAIATAMAIYLLGARPVDRLAAGYEASSRYNVQEVDAGEARRLIDAGAVVIDVRSGQAFEEGHIAGALNIPLVRLRAMLPDNPSLDRAQPIVIYSAEGRTIGAEGTSILNDAGFSGAVNLHGGVEAWRKAGLPMEKSED